MSAFEYRNKKELYGDDKKAVFDTTVMIAFIERRDVNGFI